MKIVTDSAAELSTEEREAHDITVAPLLIQFPEGVVAAEDIGPDDFYNRLRDMFPVIPTTSQPSAGVFRDIYEKLHINGSEILSIHISSGLSGPIESARTGAQEKSEAQVTLVDTLTLSGGQRYQVLAAAWAIKAGWGKERIIEQLRKIQKATEVVFTLDTLDYLARGGRIGRVQALAGSLLRLKPLIAVDEQDGKYNTVGKERTLQRAISKSADHLHAQYGKTTPMWVTVLHGQFSEQAENLTEKLKERLNVARLEVLRVSPVLGVHTGPGVVGAAVVPLELMEISA